MKKLHILTAIFCLALTIIGGSSCRQSGRTEAGASEEDIMPLPFPSGMNAAEPHLFTDSSGTVWMTWLEKKDSTATFRISRLEADRWSAPVNIATGSNWFVNWADYPQMVTNGKGDFLSAALVKRSREKYAYDIQLFHSVNGLRWQGPVIAHDDGVAAEHGFVSMLPGPADVLLTWLDGRNTQQKKNSKAAHAHAGAMTLRAAVMDYSGRKSAEWELDEMTCDCCQTSITRTDDGPVVVYRDRSHEEIRDISIVRFSKGKWSPPRTIHPDNWKIDGCPVNGPRADARGNELAVAWYSAPDNKPEVKLIFSHDGGMNFGKPLRIDEGKPLGRVDICMTDNNGAWVSWLEQDRIRLRYVSNDGTKGEALTVGLTSVNRSAGFPQMTRQGKSLVFAWTDDRKGFTIRTARMSTQ